MLWLLLLDGTTKPTKEFHIIVLLSFLNKKGIISREKQEHRKQIHKLVKNIIQVVHINKRHLHILIYYNFLLFKRKGSEGEKVRRRKSLIDVRNRT